MVKSGFQKIQTPVVRRWHHQLEPLNNLKNLGRPDHCLFSLRTQRRPENIRCRGNTENTRRLSSASSQAARPLGLTAAALAVERTSRTHRVASVRYEQKKNKDSTGFFAAGRSTDPCNFGSRGLELISDQGYGRGGTPVFSGVFEPVARVTLCLTDESGLGTCFGAA